MIAYTMCNRFSVTLLPARTRCSIQTIYIDQLEIFGDDGGAQSPGPSSTTAPVAGPVAAPVAVPVTVPTPVPVASAIGGSGIVGSAVYVERVGVKGVDILGAQTDGTALVVSRRIYSTAPHGVRVVMLLKYTALSHGKIFRPTRREYCPAVLPPRWR